MKLLIVGLGSIGQRHVRCLREISGNDVDLIAFRQRGLNLEITPELEARPNVQLEERYGIRSFTNLEEALDEAPVAALICTPNHLHLPIATELATAGLDLFLEKPVAHALAGVEELEQALSTHGRICCVGYQLRFHPGIERMISMVHAGELGHVYSAHFDFGEHMPFWHRYEDYSQTFMARESEGGGVTLTQIHDIDIIYAIFGMPATVYTVGGSTGTLAMDAEDHASSLLSYQRDGLKSAVSLTHDCLRYPPRRTYSIQGTKGSLVFDCYRNQLEWTPFQSDPQVVYHDPALQRDTLFLEQMRHFLACVCREEKPQVDLQAGIQSLTIALAIKESLKRGAAVELKAPKYSY